MLALSASFYCHVLTKGREYREKGGHWWERRRRGSEAYSTARRQIPEKKYVRIHEQGRDKGAGSTGREEIIERQRGREETGMMKVVTERGEEKKIPQERKETDGWRNRKTRLRDCI